MVSATIYPRKFQDKQLAVLADEADQYVIDHASKFTEDGSLVGLVSFYEATKVHFLTATATVFLRDVARQFPMTSAPSCFINVPAMTQLSNAGEENVQIVPVIAANEDAMLKAFYEDVTIKCLAQPCIVFTDTNFAAIRDYLTAFFKEQQMVFTVTTEDLAIQMRTSSFWTKSGVFMLD